MKPYQVKNLVIYTLLQFLVATGSYAEDANDPVLLKFAKEQKTSVKEIEKLVEKCSDFSKLDKYSDQFFCADYQFTVEDFKLNESYKELLGNIKGTSAENKLIKSQRAWITFRDAVCEYESDGYSRGRQEFAVITSCKRSKTEIRIKELEKYLECKSPGCPGEW